ncbi:hypothetical protein BCU70_21075 [Vibrio sp. 10N.286.49.C2]|uniref:hypothetical protein n=1 Tax=unclassified Vibrio TaxID=2614977 RepID=UPI000C82D471|nr:MULTISPECIES: hypothetical protein [unclassified Vibrio]PMH32814.1 hypothetical protein BCU70_21075 [Vibrio sp. 10N.286.49.C2]PMH57533.1 hypothetical protein BCU66_00660 [Vibrio sp. 10N.286.49.B1]
MDCSSLTLWLELPNTRFALAWGPIQTFTTSKNQWQNTTAAKAQGQYSLELKTKNKVISKPVDDSEVVRILASWQTIPEHDQNALIGQDLDLHW